MVNSDLSNEENKVEVSAANSSYRIQCKAVRLLSSHLEPLNPDEESDLDSRFSFNIQVDVTDDAAFAQLHTQVILVTSGEEEPLRGYRLQFVLVGVFAGDQTVTPNILGDFTRMYTLSILWPYAREYTSDQFRRTGDPFDSLPIINPQVLTESMIESKLIEVRIHSSQTQIP